MVLTSHSLLCEGSGLLTWECLVNCLRHWVPHPEPHPECDNKASVSSSDTTSFSTRSWIMRETLYDKLWTQFGTFGHYWAVFLIIPSPALIIQRVHKMQALHLVPVVHLFFVFSWCMKLFLHCAALTSWEPWKVLEMRTIITFTKLTALFILNPSFTQSIFKW